MMSLAGALRRSWTGFPASQLRLLFILLSICGLPSDSFNYSTDNLVAIGISDQDRSVAPFDVAASDIEVCPLRADAQARFRPSKPLPAEDVHVAAFMGSGYHARGPPRLA